jgi:hypothetical protein
VYEQLARVLRTMGHDAQARKIGMAKREASLARSWRRVWRVPLRVTIGHGYRPWRALGWLALMLAVGSGVFWYAGAAGAMAPARDAAGTFHFHPVVYSLDALLPVLDLQQERYWFPNLWHASGWWIRGYLWAHISMGWVLVSLLLAAWTGVIKRD